MRVGVTPMKPLPVATGLVESVNQPATSASTSTLPAALKKVSLPPAPTLTTTRFGTVCPAEKFRLETTGAVPPVGNTVR